MKIEQEYQDAIKEDENDPQLHYEYAGFLRNQGRFQDAEHEYEMVLRLEEDHAQAHLALIKLYLEPDFFNPEYATIHVIKAYQLIDQFEDEGEALFEVLEEHFRILEGIYLNEETEGKYRALAAILLGRINFEIDIPDDAVKWFYAYLDLKEHLPDAEKEAQDGIEKIENRVDELLKDKTIDNDERAQALFTRGIMRFNQGEEDTAWTLIRGARNFASPDTEVYMKATLYYIQLFIEKKDRTPEETQEALSLCDELLDYDLEDELKSIITTFKDELG